ncbi:MAG TPA: response regulator transcription factor [Candidatus Binatus sp.]|nr:response regulator transcription factor [Candidatus Binatus sp.]
MATPLRIVIADDHALFRQGLKSLLMLQADTQVVAEIESANDVEPVVSRSDSNVLLLDLQMDRWMMDDIPQLSRLTNVIVLTASESAENGVKALRLGAKGVVQKRFAIETLMMAVRSVADGLVWMPPTVQTEFARQESSSGKELTPRESEIVRYVCSGMKNIEVAERLEITESTVKTHLNNIFQKLGVRDRLELTHYAIKTGMVAVIDRSR